MASFWESVAVGTVSGLIVVAISGLIAWAVRRRGKRERERKDAAAKEKERQDRILAVLRNEYVLSHDGITSKMLAGTEPLPREWVERRLTEMGETWRREQYF